MCGIIGLMAFNHPAINADKKMEKARQEAMIILTTDLLQNTQQRGKDATGLAVLFDDSEFMGLKMGISAAEFVSRYGTQDTHYNIFVDKWRNRPSPAAMVIGHCRKPTTGGGAGPEDNANNHPIKIANTLGVHNGTIDNSSEILKQLEVTKPDGKVDSEAIFRLVNHFCKDGAEPFSNVMIQEICRRISGQYACLTFNSNNPFQMAAFRDGRPMEFALIRPLGLFLIASDKEILKASLYKYNQMAFLFSSALKRELVTLTKNDVDMISSIDDTLYIFDIRKEITDDVKIQDLYISEKIPRSPKIWVVGKGTTTTYTYPATQHNQAVPRTTTPVTPSGKTIIHAAGQAVGAATHHVSGRVGMLWNKGIGRFQSIADQRATTANEGAGNVVMDVESGKKVDMITAQEIATEDGKALVKKSSEKQLTLPPPSQEDPSYTGPVLVVTTNDIEGLLTNHAQIEIIEVVGNVAPPPAEGLPKGNKVEVDMTVTPEIVKLAEEASKRRAMKLSTISDLADLLGLEHLGDVYAIPLHALANRVMKGTFVSVWQDGYMARMKEEETVKRTAENTGSEHAVFIKRAVEKQRSARDRIRNLKIITRFLNDVSKYVPEDMQEHVMAEFLGSEEAKGFDLTTLPKLYNPAELKRSPLISTLVESITNKQSENG